MLTQGGSEQFKSKVGQPSTQLTNCNMCKVIVGRAPIAPRDYYVCG
jgi:hypothetical protein